MKTFTTRIELAARLRISPRSITKYIHARQLKATHITGAYRITETDFAAFVEANTIPAASPGRRHYKERFYTRAELAEKLQVSAWCITKQIQCGWLRACKISGQYRIAPSEIEKFIQRCAVPQKAMAQKKETVHN